MDEPMGGVESLLAHQDWVRALARRLVYDAARVDDVAQEAWLEALERPPEYARYLRACFGDVVRNAKRNTSRGEARRDHREREVARPEVLSSAAEIVEEATTQRALVGHVLELGEPYRAVVLLRFFRDLPPRRIARELSLPIETVKTRLARGLARLRERLEREGGDGDEWCRALFPLALAAPAKWGMVGALGMGAAVALGTIALCRGVRPRTAARCAKYAAKPGARGRPSGGCGAWRIARCEHGLA